jgi:hypothetical protein
MKNNLLVRIVAMSFLLFTGTASADYVYTYTGTPFTYNGSGNPAITNLSGFFDVSSALAPDPKYLVALESSGMPGNALSARAAARRCLSPA